VLWDTLCVAGPRRHAGLRAGQGGVFLLLSTCTLIKYTRVLFLIPSSCRTLLVYRQLCRIKNCTSWEKRDPPIHRIPVFTVN
jgi:hypothetical protein